MALVAGSPAVANDGWRHTVAVYFAGALINGTADIGPVEGDLDMGGMAARHSDLR